MTPEELQTPPTQIEIADAISTTNYIGLVKSSDVLRRLAYQVDQLQAENERLRLRVEPRYLNNPKFESSLILFFDWAMIWHRQAGGYLASDTSLLLGRVETFIDEMVDRNPKLECFRPNIKRLRSVPRAEELLKGEPVICLTCGQVVRLEGDE